MTPRSASWMRLRGFFRKEILQIRRDPSSILLALVMPLILLFLFGYGVSLNPTEVPIAVVSDDHSEAARDLLARFELSPYFQVRRLNSFAGAETLLDRGSVDGILYLQDDFSSRLFQHRPTSVQVIVNGIDANRARLIQGYANGTLEKWMALERAQGKVGSPPPVNLASRTWFNESTESRNFLVPGLIALIMTLIGTLLTALVIAREWERGTMEAILVTPLRSGEFLLGKILPYFGLGMLGMALTVGGGVWFFGVPLRGSLWLLLLTSALFLLASLGFGLAISATVRVQFVAAQISVIAGFLPAFFLSGLLFDLESTPRAIQVISHLVPARYFVEISHTLFLAGNVSAILVPASAALALMAVVLLIVARRKLGKRLE